LNDKATMEACISVSSQKSCENQIGYKTEKMRTKRNCLSHTDALF